MLIGLVGLPNKGKSTLFNALTGGSAQVANYPFTTIQPNEGVAFASSPCPHVALGLPKCDPNNSGCQNGIRKVPIRLLDVAGLVEGAHEGKGMGNQFLADLAQADALIVVADASGKTDDEGNPTTGHDPARDVRILEEELQAWFQSVVRKNALKNKGRPLKEFFTLLTGLKVSENDAAHIATDLELPEESSQWTKEEVHDYAERLRKISKPIVIAANKMDAAENRSAVLEVLQKRGYPVFATSAEMALAKQKAVKNGFADLDAASGKLVAKSEEPAIQKALDRINAFGDDGVQTMLDHVVFNSLKQIVAYPVEDEKKYANNFGKVLPDAFLLNQGATGKELAEKIHTDLASGFLYAIDARTKMRLGKDTALKTGDVVKIVSAK
ncbi:redox-regulated ATPase YchF [Candidatus Micrarchaeota archaeon]|nr:redox-regulated ATPase YchF [Candidatus Micrarchaeota archaeon]